jgi:hypothetical protein
MHSSTTVLTQSDQQWIGDLEGRIVALERQAKASDPTPAEPTLSAEQEAKLSELSAYLSVEQLAVVRQKMLDQNLAH